MIFSQTATSVIRFYSLSDKVTFAHLADFCGQGGPVNHTEKKKDRTFVELAVYAKTSFTFMKK